MKCNLWIVKKPTSLHCILINLTCGLDLTNPKILFGIDILNPFTSPMHLGYLSFQ